MTGDDDDGTTLIEQMVCALILSLILALVTAMLITTQRQTAGSSLRLDDLDQTRTALDALSRTIRTAVEPAQLNLSCTACTGPASSSTAIVDARSDSLQMFANSGASTGPLLVTFGTVAVTSTSRTLTRTVKPPDAGSAPNYTYTACTVGPGCNTTVQVLARGVPWPLTVPLFTYYDNTASQLTPATGASLGVQALLSIDAVSITLTVRTPTSLPSSASTTTTRVSLPNAGTGILSSPTPFAGG